MSRVRRRIARLEKSAETFIEVVRLLKARSDDALAEEAIIHAVNLAVVIAFGNPKIDEPLSRAWERVVDKFPQYKHLLSPFHQTGTRIISMLLRDEVIPIFPALMKRKSLMPSLHRRLRGSSGSRMEISPPTCSVSPFRISPASPGSRDQKQHSVDILHCRMAYLNAAQPIMNGLLPARYNGCERNWEFWMTK